MPQIVADLDRLRHLPYVGTSEAALLLGVEKPRIGRYRRTGLMPEPVAELRATAIWRTKDVLALKAALDSRAQKHVRPQFRANATRPVALVGTREAAAILGVEPTRIGRWLRTGRMPEPEVRLSATPVWRLREIERLRDRIAAANELRAATADA
jgi:predicted site-specific integrase-resolvase